jgi:NAD(P)H-nitrite reductase large subunit
VVCICKGIEMGRICDAIAAGCTTTQEANRAAGSGRGGTPVIQELSKNKGRPAPRSETVVAS